MNGLFNSAMRTFNKRIQASTHSFSIHEHLRKVGSCSGRMYPAWSSYDHNSCCSPTHELPHWFSLPHSRGIHSLLSILPELSCLPPLHFHLHFWHEASSYQGRIQHSRSCLPCSWTCKSHLFQVLEPLTAQGQFSRNTFQLLEEL